MAHSPNKKEDDMERGMSAISYVDTAQDRNPSIALSNAVTIDADLFERLYLSPKNQIPGDLRKRFANPTPVALLGFSVGLLPISTAYMGWGGAGGSAAATTTASIFFGGMLLLIAGFQEWILGNFFPFCVFMGYGAHFLTLGTTFMPFYNALAAYSPNGESTLTPEFAASFAYYPLMLGVLSFAFLLGSLRTNLIFVLIFILAVTGFGLASAAFFYISVANQVYGNKMLYGCGMCFFIASLLGWYLFFGAVIATMELPIPDLPVFELHNVIKARKRGGEAPRKPET